MRKIILMVTGLLTLGTATAQVTINADEEPKAMLDIRTSDKSNPEKNVGLVVPCLQSFPAKSPGKEQHSMIAFYSTNDQEKYGNDNSFYFWNNNIPVWDRFLDEYTIELDINKVIVSGSSLYNSSNGSVAVLNNANAPRVVYFNNIEALDESFTITNDKTLRIGRSGQYVLIMTIGLLKGGADGIMTYTAYVLVNGTPSAMLTTTSTIAFRTGRSGIFSLNSLVDLNEGDEISIRMNQEYNISQTTISAQLNSPATIYLQRIKDY